MEIAAVISFLALVVAWMGLPAGVVVAEPAPRVSAQPAAAKA
jgi:hypothetical protein